MVRFFLETPPKGNEIFLEGTEMHHLVHVHRIPIGKEIELFDSQGTIYKAKLISWNKKKATLSLLSTIQLKEHLPIQIFLAQGILKSKSWDLLLQKTMELGLYQLIPMITEYVAHGKDSAGRPERWRKVLIAAAKQCGRTQLLSIAPIQKFSEILHLPLPLKLLAHNDPSLPSLKKVLINHRLPKQILVMVGPEGGFSQEELKKAKQAECIFFSLGPYTLRAETAALAIIAILSFYAGS